MVTLLGVLAFGALGGLLLAVVISIGLFVYRTVRPHDAVLGVLDDADGYHDIGAYPAAETEPGLIIYRSTSLSPWPAQRSCCVGSSTPAA